MCDAPFQTTGRTTSCGERKVFLNLHGSGGSGHRILENASEIGSALVFRETGHVGSVNDERAGINRPYTGDRVEQSRFSCTVSADDGNEITII